MAAVARRKRQETGFGQRLRELREAAGLSQDELGERLGMAGSNVAKYERGATSDPSWSVVIRFAKALDVSPAEFLPPEGDQAGDDVAPNREGEPEPPAGPAGKRK